ncbi:MAG: hypothetical protein ABIQ11_04295, partial [Saprospiraceae bacterium]
AFHSSSNSMNAGMTIFCAALAAVCSTSVFSKRIDIIQKLSFGLLLFHLMANLSNTYNWLPANEIINSIAATLTIPLGIIWFFILKDQSKNLVQSSKDDLNPSQSVFPLNSVFSSNAIRALMLVVFGFSAVMIFYRLGYYDIWEDENLVINAALGLKEQGLDYLDEGYRRTWFHSFMIARFFDVFGVSEFTGRLPGAIFGLLFVIISFFIFARWYGVALLAALLPLVCLLNDNFLLLFRYMRMYALLIPIFLLAVYFFYRTLTLKDNIVHFRGKKISWLNKYVAYGLGSFFFIFLLAHLHKLAMIVLPVLFLAILILAIRSRTKYLKYVLFTFAGASVILAILTFILDLHALRMFRQATGRIFAEHHYYPEYYKFLLENGLPLNATITSLIAGLGLFNAKESFRTRSILFISYMLIVISLISMVYLIGAEGRDYRYIAHIVPFVVGASMYIWYRSSGKIFACKAQWILFIFLFSSAFQFTKEYKRVYVEHPWAPSYSVVYKTLRQQYKPGDALFAINVKTFYLDPSELAGERFYKVPNKKQLTMEQFKTALHNAKHGWFMWEQHKSYHWRDEILQYIYSHFQLVHGGQSDKYGIDLFYFDESMIE